MDETTMRNTASSAADTAGALADGARDALNGTMKRARRAVESAGDWAADAASGMQDASMRGYRTAEDAIRTQPVVAVGAALLVGVALGALLWSVLRED
ncbi:MAG TPA: hypothetical protein VMB76_13915 [Casimicrobiaceae bacterium]|nr:hypothetical protein [Casimicrobiaceae bacterium]